MQLLIALAVIFLVSYLSSIWFFRLDLTSDKRFTLSNTTRKILEDLPEEVYIQVYLDGDMPIGFKRLRLAAEEMLEEFRVYSKRKVRFEFINPSAETNTKERSRIYNELYKKGIKPTNVQAKDKEGGLSRKIIFPGAMVNYNKLEMPVNFLRNNPMLGSDQNLNQSVEGLEYEFINAIKTLRADTIYKIAFIEGQGELHEQEVESASKALSRYYTIDRGVMGGKLGILDRYAAVIIAKPTKRFTEADKLVLDQYLMKGGRIMWLIDPVQVDMDSLMYSSITLAFNRDLNLNDQLFHYGVRINYDLIQDIQCAYIPINTALAGNSPQYTPVPWLFFPLLQGENHPVTRNLNLVRSEFASVLDTLSGPVGIKKSVLLRTSRYTKVAGVPTLINLEDVKNPPAEKEFNKPFQSVGVLLEGSFRSAFRNRILDDIAGGQSFQFVDHSKTTRMIVLSDGDIIRNDVSLEGSRVVAHPLGQDRFTQQTYGNLDFIVNAVNYLVDDSGLMELRSRELRIRLLDRKKISKNRLAWQLINTLLPVLLIILSGGLAWFVRKKKYSSVKGR